MNELQRGDLVFVKGTDWIDSTIEAVTKSPYSHVALAVDSSTLIEAQGLHPVRNVPADSYKYHADVYRSTLDAATLGKIVKNAESHMGEKYDYFLIALELLREETGLQLHYDENEHHRIICSMLVADAVRAVLQPFCEGIRYPAPADEARDPLFKMAFSY